jgi:hypothetical protein
MTTAGLDNVGEPADGLPLHGTYNYLPAESVEIDGNRISGTIADARGIVVQRQIVNDPDRGHLRLDDITSNTGAEPQPAPMLYHCNLLLGEVDIDSESVEPRDAASAAGDWWTVGTGAERVYEHIGAQRSRVRIGGLVVEIRSSLPRLWQWVAPERGVIGIEPANCSVRDVRSTPPPGDCRSCSPARCARRRSTSSSAHDPGGLLGDLPDVPAGIDEARRPDSPRPVHRAVQQLDSA